MANLKSQLELSADATGVETGVAKAKKSLKDLGVTAATEGKKAAEGIEKIGAGGDTAAAKVDRSTKSLINSIQRVTAAQQAGGQTSSEYFRTLASQRGVDTGALKPYLDQLDAVRARQAEANAALAKGGVEFNKYGVSVKQNAAALRQVPAQLTDIIVGLQGGQAPLTVLLQQGGQLRDVFGGVVPAAKALGGAVLGLVNPYTLAASAVAGLGLAYFQGSKEADAFTKAITYSGNAAGVTVGQLTAMAQRIDAITGTQASAAAALAEFAANGNIAGVNLERFTLTAMRMEKETGQAVKETVKQFAELGKSPVDAAIKLNESTNFLTTAVYQQIKALSEQGKTAEAAAIAQRSYADSLDTRLAQAQTRLGTLERGWRAIVGAAKDAWDAMLNVGRADTLEQQIAKSAAAVERLQKLTGNNIVGGGGAARAAAARRAQEELQSEQARLDILKEQQRLLGSVADRQRENAASVKAAIKADAEKKNTARASGGSRADPEAEGKRYLESLQKQIEKTRDLSVYEQALTDIQQNRLGKISPELEKSILATSKQVDVAQRAKEALESMTTARQRAAEMLERFDSSALASVSQQIQGNQALREEIEMLGLNVAARTAVEQARLSSAIALKEEELIMLRNADASATQISALEREIVLLKERGSLLGARGVKQGEIEEIEKAKAYTKELNTDLKRAFSDAFASTKNPLRAFGDSLFSTVASRVSAALAQSMADNVLKAVGQGAGGSGGSGGGDWFGAILKMFTGSPKNALGGVYSSPGLSSYSGTVVSKPTIFPFAKGAGLMGEAGHEAILPLRRGTDGKLGVEAGGGGGGVSVTLINQSGTPLQATAQDRGTAPDGTRLLEVAVRSIADDINSGSGLIARAMESRYGLRTAVG